MFGVHGVGGIVGALLTGVFAAESLGGFVPDLNIGKQFAMQALGAGFTIVYSAVLSFAILKGIDIAIGLRVNDQEETEGLDISLHEETGYNF